MSVPENVRVNTQFPFPALVKGLGPINLTKANGVWSIAFNIANLGAGQPAAASLPADYLIYYDANLGTFQKISLAQLLTSLGQAAILFSANVNFAVGNTDTQIPIVLPPGTSRYRINFFSISGASANLSAATFGLFTAAAAGGIAIVAAGTAITVTSAAENTNNNLQVVVPANANTESFTSTPLFFRVGATAAGTGKVAFLINPVS